MILAIEIFAVVWLFVGFLMSITMVGWAWRTVSAKYPRRNRVVMLILVLIIGMIVTPYNRLQSILWG